MDLFLDFGNSSLKACLCEKEKLFDLDYIHYDGISDCDFYLNKSFDRILYSSVLKEEDTLKYLHRLKLKYNVIVNCLDLLRLEMDIDYDVSKVGCDRLLAVYGATKIYPGMCGVVIDCGTAVTVDFFKSPCRFLGGYIMLGLESEIKSLSLRSQLLSDVNIGEIQEGVPKNTNSAVRNGVLLSKSLGIHSIVKAQFEHLQFIEPVIIFTGGEGHYMKPFFDHVYFEKKLIFDGMKKILDKM